MKRTLGLDLGTSSVGWAVIDVPESEGEAGSVLAMGARVFHPGADAKGNFLSTKARERREKRARRRQVQRRARRRALLRGELTKVGLLPAADPEFGVLFDGDPNLLLKRGLKGEPLAPFELGRVIYWLAGKRGFLSLRSGGTALVGSDETFTPKRFRVSQFDRESGALVHPGQEEVLIALFKAQQEHHSRLLTDALLFGARGKLTYPVQPIPRDRYRSNGGLLAEFGLHGLVFFQRKVYWRESTIGRCSLDSSSGMRAARAERLSQRFAVWNTIVNLRVGADARRLDHDERQAIYRELTNKKTVTFRRIRRVLHLAEEDPINFERHDRKDLKGNQTDPALAKALGPKWSTLGDAERDQLVYLLVGNATEEHVRAQLASAPFSLDGDAIDKLTAVVLPIGRMAYSRKTMRRILEHLPEAEDLRDAIGRSSLATPEDALRNRGVDLDVVTNPLVRTSLHQLRKVLSALQKRFERTSAPAFDVIRIELSRDVTSNAKQRERTVKQQRENERSREEAKSLITAFSPGSENSRDAVRRARLWSEQKERCLYCGSTIGVTDLFGSRVEIDHIVPRAATLDDGMANVALVHADENRDKSGRTIFEWLGRDRMLEIADLAHSWHASRAKLNRIRTENVSEQDIPAALLVQTGYVNTLARDLVREVPGLIDLKRANAVEVSRGRLTAQLRYRTGLHKDENDHRRHALDAAMVAITTPLVAQQLSRRYKAERDYGIRHRDEYGAWEPWPGFRRRIVALYEEVLVSHKASRKVNGQLHEETHYGKVTSPHRDGKDLYARRRPIHDITSKKRLDEVADPAVRGALIADLHARGFDPDTARSFSFDRERLPRMPDGQVIKRVRCHINQPNNRLLRPTRDSRTGVTLSNNHAAYVFQGVDTGTWRIEVIPRIDAFQARRRPASDIRVYLARSGELFLFSLCRGDTLALASPDSDDLRTVLVESLDRDASRIEVVPLNSVRYERRLRYSGKALKKLGATKIVITADGQVRTAND